MTEERQGKNHRLAEWAGFKLTVYDDHEMLDHQWHHPDCRCEAHVPEDSCRCIEGCYWADEGNPPDFYASEDAFALLFDKLLWTIGCTLNAQRVGGDEGEEERTASIGVHLPIRKPGVNPWTFAGDRKEAIAEAALAYIESLAAKEVKP